MRPGIDYGFGYPDVNAELTGCAQITYQDSDEFLSPLIARGDEWRYFKGTHARAADER